MTNTATENLAKGDRISFPGSGGITCYGHIGFSTGSGFRVAVFVPRLPGQTAWVDVAFGDATPAPFPGKPQKAAERHPTQGIQMPPYLRY